jgi:GT2 family glycosyltransferase
LPDIQHRSTCFFALGGQAVFSRSKYLEIGGFDELFWPLYHEDIDLSYRAWRRGWRVLYEPRSVIHHLGAQTSSKEYKSDEIRTVVTQNMFLFQWKNIDDPAMRAAHWAWLPLRLARAAVMGDVPFLQGFGRAWARRKYAALARAEQAGQRRVGDAEAFSRMMAEIEGLSSGVPQAARREVTQSC